MSNLEYKAAYTPAKLVDRILNIPIYQRLFVWEEEQINLLLKDLEEAFKKSSNTPYYIGIITVVEKDGQWDIVDGQQRLTFLSLFGAYCCSKNEKSIWQNFLFATQVFEKKSENLRINYMGRPEDREDLIKIATGEGDIANRNFGVFKDCIEKRITDEEFLKQLAGFVYEKASFLITELPANYGPQDLNLFFEKMNATGKQLTAVEQIKGKYFPARAAEFDACLNFDKAWADSTSSNNDTSEISLGIILTYDKAVNAEDNNSTHDVTSRSILTPEVFLLHCLEILTGETVLHDERKILETFKNNMFSPRDLLSTMKNYRQWIDANIIYLRESSDGSWECAFRSEDNKEKEYEDKAKNESVSNVNLRLKRKQFQAMLYVSSSNYQEWVLKAYQSKEKILLNLLMEQDKKRHQNNENPMTYHSIDRYWFWKLDYLLWEKFIDDEDYFSKYKLTPNEKEAIRNYKFRRNRSIEHLHPQTDRDIAEWKEAKHCFGNLAMISSSFNSLQQNDSIGVKFARLRDTQIPQKNLESIKMLLMFKCAGGQESGWTVKVMQDHENEMLDLLK